MGGLFSKDAGLTADEIEKFYDSIAKSRAASAAADGNEVMPANDDQSKVGDQPGESERDMSGEDAEAADPDSGHGIADGGSSERVQRSLGGHLASEIVRNATADAAVHLTAALHALMVRARDTFAQSIGVLAKLSDYLKPWARKTRAGGKGYPWGAAAVLIPLLLSALTPGILGAVGFTAGGIAAGSIAASIQAGIGNVVVNSAFAILTSAGMGGFGVPIVVGSVWAGSSAILWSIVVLRRWWRGDDDDDDDDDDVEASLTRIQNQQAGSTGYDGDDNDEDGGGGMLKKL